MRTSQIDEGVIVASDTLVVSIPTAKTGVVPDGRYRVYLPSNSLVSTLEMKRILTGKVERSEPDHSR